MIRVEINFFFQVLQIPVNIPKDPLFAPSINVRVFDDRMVHKPLVGTRSIGIAPFVTFYGRKKQLEDLEADLPKSVDLEDIPGAKLIKPEDNQVPEPVNY